MLAFHASDGQLHGLSSEQLVIDVGALKLGFSLLNIVGALGLDSNTLVSGSNVDVLTFLLSHSEGLIKILGLNQIVIAGYLVLKLELIDVSIVLKSLLLLKELVVEKDLALRLIEILLLQLECLVLLLNLDVDLLSVLVLLLVNLSSEDGLLLVHLGSDLFDLSAELHLADLSILSDLLTEVGLEILEESLGADGDPSDFESLNPDTPSLDHIEHIFLEHISHSVSIRQHLMDGRVGNAVPHNGRCHGDKGLIGRVWAGRGQI